MREADGQDAARQLRTAEEGDALVLAVLRRHGDVVLRVARRHSLCEDDAADASQRALEIFVRHVRRLEAETAHSWLFRVARNEAITIREQRQRLLGPTELLVDELEARHVESPEDRVIGLEATAQAAEALLALKPSELQALVMQASGDSMAGIAQRAGWTPTKVNRAVTEGRRRLRAQRDAIADGRECERWGPALIALVAGEADARALAAVRPHLRNCGACRAQLRALHRAGAPAKVAGVAPAGLAGLSFGPGRLADWFARVQDTLAAGIHEHVLVRVLQVQAAAEALSAGQVVAVAASAAAIASGGAVVVEGAVGPPGEHRSARVARPGDGSAGTREPGVAVGLTRPTTARRSARPIGARVAGPLRSSGTIGAGAAPQARSSQGARPGSEFRARAVSALPAEVRAAQRPAAVTRSPVHEHAGPPTTGAAGPREFTPAPPAAATPLRFSAASASARTPPAQPLGEFAP